MKTAVIIGSTGLIGSHLLEKLAREAGFNQIIAIVRRRPVGEVSLWSNSRVRCIEFDFTKWPELELQLRSFIGPQPSAFFCCLGTTIGQAGSEEAFRKVDFSYVLDFAKLAQACRAESLLVVSALGADKGSSVFYNKIKGETECAVADAYRGRLHFFRPSLLLGDRKDFRFGERVAVLFAPLYSPLLFGPLEQFKPIKADHVARAMMNIATKQAAASTIVNNLEIESIATH